MPLDGSEQSERGLSVAVRLRAPDGVVHLIRAVPIDARQAIARLEAESHLDLVVSGLQEHGVAAQGEVVAGRATAAIARTIRRDNCDLLVSVGPREAGGGVAGTTTVLWIPPGPDAGREGKVAALVDRRGAWSGVVNRAAELAHHLGSGLLIFYPVGRDSVAQACATAKSVREIASGLRAEGRPVHALILQGDPCAAVKAAAIRWKAALLVAGRRSAAPAWSKAGLPVLLVPE